MKKLMVAVALMAFVSGLNAQNTAQADKKDPKTEMKSCEGKKKCCKKGMKACAEKKDEAKVESKDKKSGTNQ